MSPSSKQNPTRRILYLVGGLFLLVLAGGLIGKATGLLGNGDKGLRVETAPAEIRTLTQVVTASGRVQPEVEVEISPDVSGEIIFLGVEEGDWVEKGALLVRIKPDFYAAQVEQAQANVSQALAGISEAKAQRLKAELDLARQDELFKKEVISQADFQTAQTQFEITQATFDAAQYRAESAQAALREAREQLGKTTIYAPMSGTVSQLNIEVGERVVGTTQMQGTEILRIARLDQMEVLVDVNENDVVNVALGDTARIEVDAYPERTFKGVVTEIANSARVSSAGTQEQVTNFPVKVRIVEAHDGAGGSAAGAVAQQEVPLPLDNTDARFRPGMSGTVDIFTKTVVDAVSVPIQAVTVRDINQVDEPEQPEPDPEAEESIAVRNPEEDLRKVVFVVQEGKAHMVEVETGISDDTHIHIRQGLAGGETIIIGPYSAVSRELKPDAPIQTDDAPRPPTPLASTGR